MSQLDEKQKNIMEKIKFYDIKVIDKTTGATCQPNGLVTIRLPIPDDFDRDELEALRVMDGQDVEYYGEEVKLIDGTYYLEFETDHFSYYALMDLLTQNDQTYKDSVTTDNPSTGDTINWTVLMLMISIFGFVAVALLMDNMYRKETEQLKNKVLD